MKTSMKKRTSEHMTEILIQTTKTLQKKKAQNDYSLFCLKEEDVWKIYNTIITASGKAIFLLLYQSCLRDHEVANLKIEDIDWNRKLINLKIYKGHKKHAKLDSELVVPISDKCFEHLQIVRGKRTSGWLFVGRTPSKHINEKSINYFLAQCGKKAGITNPIPKKIVRRFRNGNEEEYLRYVNINPHLLRHSGIRHYLDKGGDIRMAQKLARHKDIRLTIQTYGAPSIESRIEEFKRLIG